jgi:periplasmic divalent cation tolerance protein
MAPGAGDPPVKARLAGPAPVLQVQTTFDREEDADRIGRLLVERGLATCAQLLGPVRSVYRWQGSIETAVEWLCLLKTTGDAYPALEAELRREHPYDEPEIIALPVERGSFGYLDWVRAGITASSDDSDDSDDS